MNKNTDTKKADFLKLSHKDRLEYLRGNINKPPIESIKKPISKRAEKPNKPPIEILISKNKNDEQQLRIYRTRIKSLRERIERTSRDIETITREIKKVEGAIAWDQNRSRQARTICERGF